MTAYFELEQGRAIADLATRASLAAHRNTDGESASSQNGIDYMALTSDGALGLAELQGAREEQEDNLSFGLLNSLPHYTARELAERLSFTISSMAKRWNSVDPQTRAIAGSTLSATIVDGDKLVTATLGDSMTYVAIYDGEHRLKGVRRTNQFYHTPRSELARILKSGGKVFNGRLYVPGVSLGVSRAIGDDSFKPFVEDTPTIEIVSLEAIAEDYGLARKDAHMKLITCCDGVFDRLMKPLDKKNFSLQSSDEYYLYTILSKIPFDASPNLVARGIIQDAFRRGSKDNISTIVRELATDTYAYQGVYDGHGGHQVSLFLACELLPALRTALTMPRSALQIKEGSVPEIIDHALDSRNLILYRLKRSTTELLLRSRGDRFRLKAAVSLQRALDKACDELLYSMNADTLEADIKRFQIRCHTLLSDTTFTFGNRNYPARAVLESAPNLKQILLHILSCILTLGIGLAFGLYHYSTKGYFDTGLPFFRIQSAQKVILNDVEKSLNLFNN